MAVLYKHKFPEEIRHEIDTLAAKVNNDHPEVELVETNDGTTIRWQQSPSLSQALTQVTAGLHLLVKSTQDSARQMALSSDFKQIGLAWHN